MILQNKRGLRGKETTPVALVASFMNEVFNIEKEYQKRELFTIIENGEKRMHLLHHLTNADLQTATILLKVCNLQGVIEQTNPHSIYHLLREHYEAPISISQFYTSLKKFILHQLIKPSYNKYSNLYTYRLNHYLNPRTGKIGYYVALTPFVFTRAFSKISIAKKKLFYSVYLQQGEKTNVKKDAIERRLLTDKEDVQYSGLSRFLHRHDVFHIKKILDELASIPMFEGAPLFQTAKLVKRGREYHKAILFIHPKFFPESQYKYNMHEYIPVTVSYKRKANFIKKLIEEWGIGELLVLDQGRLFMQIINIFKGCSYRVIRYALHQLKLYQQENGYYPDDICQFIAVEIRNKSLAMIIDIAQRTEVYPFIAPEANGYLRREREYEFASKLSSYPLKLIEQACKLARPYLLESFTLPSEHGLGLGDYSIEASLNELGGIDVVRFYALKQKKNRIDYAQLEERAAKKYESEKNSSAFAKKDFIDWMLQEVDTIARREYILCVPENFKLEEYILMEIIPKLN